MEKTRDESRFNQLSQALATGWEIEEPVMLGVMWRSAAQYGGTYHFVLRNKIEGKTTLLSLPPSPQLLIFLAENNVNVSPL